MARDGWQRRTVGLGTLVWGIVASATLPAQVPPPSGPGPWLASPQHTTNAAGLTLKQLVRMSPCQLEQLYAQGCLAPVPLGKVRGQALLNPGTRLALPSSRVSRLVWQGKVFHADGRTAINRFFGLRMIRANVYNAESWRDGRPALILDYSQTSLLYAPYRDEIRQIAPGLYLGLMFDRNTCPPKLKMYFALECLPNG